MVHVPSSYNESNCVPLLLTWHGAGGAPSNMMPKWTPVSDSNGFIVVAPPHNGSGEDWAHAPDVRTAVAALYNIDLNACYVNGFSAGGQTAFGASIGTAGWTGIMAFSAGVAHTPPMPNASGLLPVYWVFGDTDGTFGGISTIRQQVQWVESEGHNVNFIEVPGGGHDLGISNAGEAWSWITNPANRP
jgi:phospholipase/carboxylesterase